MAIDDHTDDQTDDASESTGADSVLRAIAAAPPVPPPADLRGTQIGRYRVLALLGKGGMGQVYEAQDLALGRRVAIKFVRDGAGDHAPIRARFLREQAITASLEHPGIVAVYDAGTTAAGELFYVMRIARGEPLARRIAQATTAAARRALLPSVIAVADAVAFAHDQRIIHRDLKPSNVLVGAFGETLVADWGLAKRLDEPEAPGEGPAATPPVETATGAVMGTPRYMAPEQAGGGRAEPRSDVFSIGAMLRELAFDGLDPREVRRIGRSTAADLAAITRRATATDPAARYQTASELADDLRRALAGERVLARRYSWPERVARWARRRRRAIAIACAIGGLVAAALIAGARAARERSAADQARADAARTRAGMTRLLGDKTLDDARAELERDPTAALALLKRFVADPAADARAAAAIASDAVTRGVARDVWDLGQPVAAVAFSPDGAAIAATARTALAVIAVDTGRVATYPAADGIGDGLAFSPDGAALATSDGRDVIRLWDRATGASRRIAGHDLGGGTLQFSADSRMLLVRRAGAGGRLWRLPAGTEVALPGGQGQLVAFVAAHTVAIARDRELALFDVDAGRIVAHAAIGSMPFDLWASGDGRWIAAALFDALVLWNPATGALRRVAPGADAVALITPSGDGASIMSCGHDATELWLFDIAAASARKLTGDEGCRRQTFTFSPDSSVFASAGFGGELRLHLLREGRIRRLSGHRAAIMGIAFSPDGRLIASGSTDHTVRLWPWRTGEVRSLPHLTALSRAAANARVLARDTDGDALFVLDLRDGSRQPIAVDRPHPSGFSLSGDGSTAALLYGDRTVALYDLAHQTHRVLGPIAELATANESVEVLSTGGELLAQADGHGVVRVHELGSGRSRQVARLGDLAFTLQFSDDDRWLAAGGRDGVARVVDVATGAERARVACPGWVWNAQFSRDGARLATACADGSVRVAALAGGPVQDLAGHTGSAIGVDFAADGRLATSGADGVVRLWDLATGAGTVVHREPGLINAVYFLRGTPWFSTRSASGHTYTVWDVAALPPCCEAPALRAWLDATTRSELVAAPGSPSDPPR